MNSSPHPSFQSVHVQLLITIFLAVLLWALYQRLRKVEFFHWWAWAWTCSAVFLAAAIESVAVGPDWTPLKISLMAAVLVFGMLQSLLLALGGLSWSIPERSLKKIFRTGLWLTLAISAAAFWAGFHLRSHRDVSFAARNLPRTLTMMAALGYCCVVFFGQWRRKKSWAALMSGAFCLFYALNQVSYTIDFVGVLRKYYGTGAEITPNPIDHVQVLLGSPLFFLDLVHICGICLGMILLLVEQSQSTERNLEVSERRRLGLAVNNVELQQEIDERHRVEHALRESEAKFRLVAETAPCAIWILQGERVVYVNRYAETLSGYSREELFSMNAWELVDPEFRTMGEQRYSARLRGENPEPRYQFRIRTKAGELRWLDFSGARTNFEGKPAILATAFDITAIKRAEQQLLERTMYLDALIANSPLGIVTKDEQNRVVFCNPAFERMFHYSQSELQGKDIDSIIASHDLEEASRMTFAVHDGGVVHATAQRRKKDGTLIDVELHGIRVYSGETFVGAFAIYQDISERRRSEEKLQALRNRLTRTQEEERSRIARDLHDDIGQRLAILSIDLEQMKLASQQDGSAFARELEALVRTAGEITSDVHNISRRLHPSQVELLGLAPALNNFCREFANRNSMRIQFTSACLTCKVPEEASLCLFRVAQEAIRNVHKHSGCREALVELDEISGSLRLRISDRGAGFDPVLAEATQGLGLLSMEERLRSMGGELFVHSRPGGGTCIEACIPATQNVPA
ncbi:MAG TPA: PAS domain S-box protein [Candidatus Baltobacteraceae bacterium]|nr:PAS domain S-box protein [Candidatus Baltobacteraceae bacterium]